MKTKLFLAFAVCFHALAAPKSREPSPEVFFRIALDPARIEREVDIFVETVLWGVNSVLWEELYFNPEHENATLKIQITIKSDSFYHGYELDSPPGEKNLDERFFSVTSQFGDRLKRDLCCNIISSNAFKSLSSSTESKIG